MYIFILWMKIKYLNTFPEANRAIEELLNHCLVRKWSEQREEDTEHSERVLELRRQSEQQVDRLARAPRLEQQLQ